MLVFVTEISNSNYWIWIKQHGLLQCVSCLFCFEFSWWKWIIWWLVFWILIWEASMVSNIKKWKQHCDWIKKSTDFCAHQDGKVMQIQDWIEINIKNINTGYRFSEFSFLLCSKFIRQNEIFYQTWIIYTYEFDSYWWFW